MTHPHRRTIQILFLTLLLIAWATPAEEPDRRPASFFGTVTVDGSPVPAGTPVKAAIGGTTFAESTVFSEDGEARFRLHVPADLPETTLVEGGTEGAAVTFSVGGGDAPADAASYERRERNALHRISTASNIQTRL